MRVFDRSRGEVSKVACRSRNCCENCVSLDGCSERTDRWSRSHHLFHAFDRRHCRLDAICSVHVEYSGARETIYSQCLGSQSLRLGEAGGSPIFYLSQGSVFRIRQRGTTKLTRVPSQSPHPNSLRGAFCAIEERGAQAVGRFSWKA